MSRLDAIELRPRREGILRVSYRLLSGTILDRLRRLEANSLITNFTLLLAFRFGLLDLSIRLGVTFLLNVFVYFINDFIDVQIDLASGTKDRAKALYLQEHRRTAFALIACGSAGLLLLTLFYSRSVCFGVVLALLTTFLYTDYFKNIPFLDIAGCFVWGIAMAWPAIPDFSWEGIRLVLLIGIFAACFEVVQCVKDFDSDRASGLRTTPVVLGIPKAFLIARSLYVLSAIYTVLVLGQIQGAALLLPILFSTKQKAESYWLKLRLVFGAVWLLIMARLFFGGQIG
ncbi:MAG: UbiA family prenyltransferase [bacterium]